jgi:serine/threonine protein kinase
MSEWVGRTLSKVEIQKLLGRGGMADVYLGRHTTLNRPVAVKLLHAHLTEDSSLLARFRAEAQAVATMRHPHIVQVLDFDTTDQGQPYIIMELLEGLSLKDYLIEAWEREKALEPETIVFLINSLASALDYAHAHGIVHRDVKPANVMLRSDGPIDPAVPLPHDVDVVLTDFGVAHVADAGAQTASGTIIGTPAYMSPEQVRGEGIDGRSDIYALGIMLYEMLTGQLPFDGDTQASILIKHISQSIPQIAGTTPEIQAVVNRALSKDADRRYQKASDLASALEAVMSTSETVSLAQPRPRPAMDDSLATKQLDLTPRITAPGAPIEASETAGGPPVRRRISVLPLLGGLIGIVVLIGGALLLMRPRGTTPDNQQGTQASEIPLTQQEDALSPTAESSTEAATQAPDLVPTELVGPVGIVLLRDNIVSIALNGIEPPVEGSVYEAWLIEPGTEPLGLGVLEVADGKAALDYEDAAGRNLVNEYSGFAVSIEPASDSDPTMSGTIVYAGQIPEDQLNNLRLMFSVMRDAALKASVLEGITRQSTVYDAHLDNTIDAIAADNIPSAKTHAEHVVNITVGRNRTEYLDYDGNGRADNPGDGVGLMTYLTILQQSTATANGDAANSVIDQAEEIILIITDGKNDELSVTAADTLEELDLLAEELQGLHVDALIDPLIQAAQGLDFAIPIDVVAQP